MTRFTYAAPVSESVMELRMRPTTDAVQRCLQFDLQLQPRARVFAYQDSLGNWVHHFDLPRRHAQLSITARAHVQIDDPTPLPAALDDRSWDTVDRWVDEGEHWDFRQPSRFAEWTAPLVAFAANVLGPSPRDRDPLTLVRDTTRAIHETLAYVPKSTRVDSPIDEALAASWRVPGLHARHARDAAPRAAALPLRQRLSRNRQRGGRRRTDNDREACLGRGAGARARLDWRRSDQRHGGRPSTHPRRHRPRLRRCPPTRGVFKGGAASSLAVSVEITPGAVLPTQDPAVTEASWVAEAPEVAPAEAAQRQMQQQQQ